MGKEFNHLFCRNSRYIAAGKALDLYTRPYTQIAAYVMGMLCAVLVESLKDRPPNFTTVLVPFRSNFQSQVQLTDDDF